MSGLTRVTAFLVPAAVTSLNATAARTKLSRGDVLNRALQVYDALTAELQRPRWGRGTALVLDLAGDGREVLVRLMPQEARYEREEPVIGVPLPRGVVGFPLGGGAV